MVTGEAQITLTGNITQDIETRQAGGSTVASFSVAVQGRTYDKQAGEYVDGTTTFFRCSAWRELGDHVASSLGKGDRVMVTGRIEERTYTTQQGEERRSMDVTVDEIGASLRYATVQTTRAVRNNNQQQRGHQRAAQQGRPQQQRQAPRQQQVQEDPWSTGGSDFDDTPF